MPPGPEMSAASGSDTPAAKSASLRQSRLRTARQAALWGIVVNGNLAVIKAAAGIFGNAYVLIADALESLTDVFSSLVVWLGLRVAARPPDAQYPYGRGRAETLAAVLVALMLLLAAGWISWESLRQIQTPHRAPAPVTLLVLLLVIAIKETLYRVVLHIGEDVDSIAIKADAWHHRSDAITSAAAFLGICIAVWGGPGYEAADDWAALVAAALIAVNAIGIAQPAVGEILDRAPDRRIEAEIRRLAASVSGVAGTHKCLVRKLGLEFFVDLDLQVDGQMTVEISHQLAHSVQDLIRLEMPYITKVLIHVEPAPSAPAQSIS